MINHDIHYESTGSGRPVLFIHAGVADSRMWNRQFDQIEGYQLIRYDMRGYGLSPLGTHSFVNATDGLAVLDILEVANVTLVGCSMGGMVALEICQAAPDRVDGLVLVGADAPGFDPGIDYVSPEWPDAVTAFEAGDLARVAELEAEIWLAGIGRTVTDMDRELVDLFITMDLIALQNETARDDLEASTPLESFPDLDVPVRVMVGERDIPQLQAAAHHIAGALSEDDAIVLEDTAHLPSMDRPKVFNTAIEAFLGAL